jgi:hypothetical protein
MAERAFCEGEHSLKNWLAWRRLHDEIGSL